MCDCICVGVCTFRRPSLFETLGSLAELDLPENTALKIIVADNDDTAALMGKVTDFAALHDLDIRYVHAPARNISIARNACLDAADGDFLAFLDDDEIADPGWLSQLLATAAGSHAGVVLGPAVAIYPADAPGWMRDNDFHSNRPVPRGDVVETGYSSNVLLDLRDPRVRQARFDHAFGRTGGEDVDFFFNLYRQGVTMVIDNAAIVREPVAPARMSFRWLVRRRRQTGAIYSHCAINGSVGTRLRLMAGSTVKIVYCAARALGAAANRSRCTFWIMRGSFHSGVLSGCFSRPQREVYGTP